MSPEAAALMRLDPPEESRPGDMWCNRRLGMVILALGHKRTRGRKHTGQKFCFLYHWGEESLHYNRDDWADETCTLSADSFRRDDETWRYAGNLFEALPYQTLAGVPYRGANKDY